MRKLYLSSVAIFFASMSYAAAETTWEYSEIKDEFTDKTHHVALIKDTSTSSSDYFRAGFECRNGRDFVFTIDANEYLGGRNQPFRVRYRVDNKRAKTIKMRTFSNSETGGMNSFSAIDIANDFLNAKRMRLRTIAINGDRYDTELSLTNSRDTILKAVEACGLNVQ